MLYVEGEIIYAWPNAAQLGKGSRTSYTNTNLKSDQTYYYNASVPDSERGEGFWLV